MRYHLYITSPFDSTIEDVNISKMVELASDVLIEDVEKRFSDYMEMAGVREKTCQIMNDIIISNNIRKTGD